MKPDITMDEIVEGMAKMIHDTDGIADTTWPEGDRLLPAGHQYPNTEVYRNAARSVLTHLLTAANITEAQLIALARGEAVVAPVGPTEAMKKAGQIAADNKLWKWRGLGARGEGDGLDGMTVIIAEAYCAMLAALKVRP